MRLNSRPALLAAACLFVTTAGLLGTAPSRGRGRTPAQVMPEAPQFIGSAPPAPGVIRLFTGRQEDIAANWVQRGSNQPAHWRFEDGAMVCTGGDITTRAKFTDYMLHIEFKLTYEPTHFGQERANSGVYMQGRYEIQVLDSSLVKEPGTGDCGAVYNQAAPLLKAYRPPLTWQTYDIVFRAPRENKETHTVAEPARITIFLNGVPIQNNQEIRGPTGGQMDNNVLTPGPILLQDHGHPIAFRNIWILPLPEHGATHY